MPEKCCIFDLSKTQQQVMKKSKKETVTVTEKVYKVLGYTEDVCVCGCCGREDLKGTVALEIVATTEVVYFGIVCAAKAQGYTKKHTEELVKESVKQARLAANAEIQAHPVKAEVDAFMAETDKELAEVNKGYLTTDKDAQLAAWKVVVDKRFAAGARLDAVKEEIRKKYMLKYL